MLVFDHVSVAYGQTPILQELSFSIADGEQVVAELTAATAAPAAATAERSPFMPSPPGGDKKKK